MKKTLIKGAALFLGVENRLTQPAAVLITNGRIEAAGREAELREAEADETIECKGQTLLPGLIDCHNHLSLDPTLENYLFRMNDSIPELTIRAVQTMAVDLASGVTTARCLGDKGFLDVVCKKALAEGKLAGPRLLVATRGIRAPHGHGFVGYPFCGVEDIRKAVRENLAAGADLIKIYITGTLRSSQGLPHYFSRDEIQTLVDEAHRVGVPVATHCIGGPGLNLAVDTGIDVIEHGYFISDEQIDLMIQARRWLVMTPSIFFTDARIQTLPANLVEGHLQQRNEVQQRLTAAIRAGVKIAAGTDGMHGGLAREVQYLTQFGASPFEALASVTANAAKVCGLEDRIGTIEKGKLADIIGVEGNPLDDVCALQRVKTVMQAGVLAKGPR